MPGELQAFERVLDRRQQGCESERQQLQQPPPIRAPNPQIERLQDDGLSVKKSNPLRASLYSDVTQLQSPSF